MIVDGYRQYLFRVILTDHVLVEKVPDLCRRPEVNVSVAVSGGRLLREHLIADTDALVADVDAVVPGEQLVNLVRALAAETALKL